MLLQLRHVVLNMTQLPQSTQHQSFCPLKTCTHLKSNIYPGVRVTNEDDIETGTDFQKTTYYPDTADLGNTKYSCAFTDYDIVDVSINVAVIGEK